MTATQAYYDWVNDGRHWSNAQPVEDLKTTLEGLGYTIYTIGDDSHLTAYLPEDHTPFSATGWPYVSPKGRVCALDIMPKAGLPDLVTLAHALITAKDAGDSRAAFIKYMNWTDSNGQVLHTSWEPSKQTRSSSDSGHIHVSIRTDYVDSDCAAGWNPLEGSSVIVPISSGPTTPIPNPSLDVDGRLGPLTVRRWQQVMGTPVDGIISTPSMLVKAVQRHLNAAIGAGLVIDGIGIRQDGKFYHTVKALQAYLGTPQDGVMSVPVSSVVKAVQTRLNEGRF
jgi:hypothetical protein